MSYLLPHLESLRTKRRFMVNGLKQPVAAVCEALEDQGKGIIAKSLMEVYQHALESCDMEDALISIIAKTGEDISDGLPTSPPLPEFALGCVEEWIEEHQHCKCGHTHNQHVFGGGRCPISGCNCLQFEKL